MTAQSSDRYRTDENNSAEKARGLSYFQNELHKSTAQVRNIERIEGPERVSGNDPRDVSDRWRPQNLISWYYKNGSSTGVSYGGMVACTFTSIFYDRIKNSLSEELGELSNVFIHNIEIQRHRHFKCAVPYLLSENRSHAFIRGFFCIEVLASMFYIWDSLYDKREERYKKQNSVKRYGAERCKREIERLKSNIDESLLLFEDYESIVRYSINQFSYFQERKNGLDVETNKNRYLDICKSRTNLYGLWWTHFLDEQKKYKLSELTSIIYPKCAKCGQIKNDIKDIALMRGKKGNYISDIERGDANYVIIKLWNKCSNEERMKIKNIWGSEIGVEEINWIVSCIDKYGIIREAKEIVSKESGEIISNIRKSSIRAAEKEILIGWIYDQILNGIGFSSGSTHSKTDLFVRSIKRII